MKYSGIVRKRVRKIVYRIKCIVRIVYMLKDTKYNCNINCRIINKIY